jgi:hypothetical protein
MLFIHIGPMKTGTSTIQRFLLDNARALEARGIIYTSIGRAARSPHHNVAHELLGNGYFNVKLGDIGALVTMAKAADESMIVSSEMLASLTVDHVRAFKERLLGVDVRIISYVRYPTSFMRSLYAQSTKTGRRIFDFDGFFDHLTGKGKCTIRRWVDAWGEVFGWESLRVRSLDQLRTDGAGLLQDFAAAIGVDLVGLTIPQNENVSPDWRSVELLRALYTRSSRMFQAGKYVDISTYRRLAPVRKAIAKAADEAARGMWPEKRAGDYFTAEQIGALSAIYAADVDRFRPLLPDLALPVINGDQPRQFLPDSSAIEPEARRRFYQSVASKAEDALRSSGLAASWDGPHDLRIV